MAATTHKFEWSSEPRHGPEVHNLRIIKQNIIVLVGLFVSRKHNNYTSLSVVEMEQA